MTFSSWSITKRHVPFFLLLICTRKLCLAKWPQLRIKVIRRRFKTIIGSVIPHFMCLRACVSCATCTSCAKLQQRGEKTTRMMHVDDCEVIFIYLFTCCTLCVVGRKKRRKKIDGVALCQPRAVQVPVDPLSLLCSKKGNYNVNVSQRGVNPPRRTWKVDGESRVTVG